MVRYIYNKRRILMKKSDWIDYFEAVNGRSPEEQELAAALAAGEFEDESTEEVPVVEDESTEEVPAVESESTETVSKVEEKSQQSAPQESELLESETEDKLESSIVTAESETVSDSTTETNLASESITSSSASEPNPVTIPQAVPTQPMFENIKTNPQVQELKQKGLDYFSWVLKSLKSPTEDTENGNIIYSALTLAFAAIFMAMAIVFFFRNILLSFANLTIGGESIEFSQPELYDHMVDSINSGLGVFAVIKVSLILLVFYIISLLIPALVNGLAQNKLNEIKEKLASSSRFAPLLLIINFLAFLTTFLMKTYLVISEDTPYELAGILYNAGDNSAGAVAQFAELMQEVPALESIMQVGSYITFFVVVGFVILLVAFIKNIRVTHKKLDAFYISVGLVCILLVITIATNRLIYGSMINAFEDIYYAFSI
ncbi:TPA: hypothetical protein ACGO8F_001335 [Streptococcus suis]